MTQPVRRPINPITRAELATFLQRYNEVLTQ